MANPVRLAVSKAKDLVRDVLLGSTCPNEYRKAARQPVVANRVLFADTKERQMPDSFQLIWDRLAATGQFELEFYSLEKNFIDNGTFIRRCVELAQKAATASCIFLCDASDVISCLPLRPETRVVQLWHACGAFKKWGMSSANLLFGKGTAALEKHPFYRNLSLVTVSSPEVAWAYIEAMVLEDRPAIVKALGVSRTDVFFDEAFLSGARVRVEQAFPQARGKRILLYAPTYRGSVNAPQAPDQLDIAALKAALGQEWVLLVKQHPYIQAPTPIPAGCEAFAADVTHTLPIDALLCAADACVSDYSSIVFEYSLFNRPMAFFAYDIDDYRDWRGFYYSYDDLTPGPVLYTNEELADYLTHLDERFDAEQVRAFRERFMSACDGHATDRICLEVFGDTFTQVKG